MASAADFLNPWFGRPSPSLPIKGHLSEGPPENGIDVYEPFDLPVIGQGTIAIQSSAKELLQITVNSKDLGGPSLVLFIAKDKWKLVSVDATGVQSDIVKDLKPIRSDEDCWLETSKDPSDKALYWLSIDKAFGRLRYGKRFINTSMTSLETVLKEPDPNDKDDTKTWIWKDPTRDQWMEQLLHVEIVADGEKLEDLDDIVLGEVPLVTDLSPYVVTDEEIDLETLENGHFTVPANLPQACQRLYNNIAGKSVSLNTSKYPYFSKAIQYSCETPGCWAYEKLWAKAKKGELGNDILGTYLRITLGYNQGNSPGVPYVLEIWPSGHFSPIHDHGTACAVIKIMYGEIEATYYDSLKYCRQLGNTAKLTEGQITWLGENNYQIHKLHNTSNDVCCTIQCYSYSDTNKKHEDVFNFANPKGESEKWVPTSDSTFVDFRDRVMKEWSERPKDKVWQLVDRQKTE